MLKRVTSHFLSLPEAVTALILENKTTCLDVKIRVLKKKNPNKTKNTPLEFFFPKHNHFNLNPLEAEVFMAQYLWQHLYISNIK